MIQLSDIIARLWELMLKLGIIQDHKDFSPTCLELVKTTEDPYYDDEGKVGYSGPLWF